MILSEKNKNAFSEYGTSLRYLEKSFNKAGLPVTFRCVATPNKTKIVDIIKNFKVIKQICIEGDSPAQAVKDVAEAVKL
jgi:hypothetical protein